MMTFGLRRRVPALVLATAFLAALPAQAQEAPPTIEMQQQDTVAQRRIGPGTAFYRSLAQDTMLARILSDPDSFQQRVDDAETIVDIRNLIGSREEQRQDWIAYTLFVTLASGVDAFVAAHLADFPATITTRTAPDGGMRIQVGVPLPRRRP
jgi:hypothetical protein